MSVWAIAVVLSASSISWTPPRRMSRYAAASTGIPPSTKRTLSMQQHPEHRLASLQPHLARTRLSQHTDRRVLLRAEGGETRRPRGGAVVHPAALDVDDAASAMRCA